MASTLITNETFTRLGPLQDTVAPDFSYPTFTNDTVRLRDVLKRQKAVILDFWYTSCGPCQRAIPALVSLYAKYRDRGLEILGINPFDKRPGTYKWAIKKFNITYPLVLADTNVAKHYRSYGFPNLYVIDHSGNIVYTHQGYSDDMEAILTKELDNLLN